MADFKTQKIASSASEMIVEKGKTFAFVSGLGGESVMAENSRLAVNPWWASVYTQNQQANYGALFIIFSPDGQTNKAIGYVMYKTSRFSANRLNFF